jgi:iron complex transport system substrate-binding protein
MNRFTLLCLALLLAVLPTAAQETNLLGECVTEYDPNRDYFPDKLTVDEAVGFTVEYHNHYKIVNVLTPFPGATADDAFQYMLVQCGTPIPDDAPEGALVVEVPARKVVAMSTTFLPHFVALDELDTLVGLDSFLYVNTPEVVTLIEEGALAEVGFGSSINLEVTIAAEPDLVVANASSSPEYDAYPVLLDSGIPTVISGDYVEQTPLGRAEWLKFTALFLNREAEADEVFAREANAYTELVALTANLADRPRPTVLWGSYSSYGNAWYVPGNESFVAQLLNDAGLTNVLEAAPELEGMTAAVPFDFEAVLSLGLDAQIWIPDSFGVNTLADLLAQDERYADFAAFQKGEVYTNGKIVNANGGNDYYETGVLYPHLILQDLIKVGYPDLMEDVEFTYTVKLE